MNTLQKVANAIVSGLTRREYNLFGTLGKTMVPVPVTKDFIPKDGDGNIIDLKGDGLDQGPSWMGLESKTMQFFAYKYCAPLAGVIERLAEADTNGRIEFVDENGNTVKNINKSPRLSKIKKLLNNPNPLQTREEFKTEQIVLAKIFGYCPVFVVCPSGMDKSNAIAMFNLNPYFLTPVENENYSLYGNTNKFEVIDGKGTYVWDGIDRTNKIKEWMFSIQGVNYTIPSSEILLIKDGLIEQTNPNIGLPISKVAGLDFNISNINAAMEADNVLLKKKGPLGVFSGDSKPDIAGMTPMPPDEQDDLQLQLSKYNLTIDKLQYIISRWPIKWNPISFNARDLMTKETARMGIDCICDRLGYPAELMSGKNATYENRSSSEKFLYQNNIIPFSIRTTARYNKFFGLDDVKIYIDYNHLPILQEDILKAGQAHQAESAGLLIEWTAGQLTWNQWQVARGRDSVAGMDIYYPEYIKMFPNMDKQKTVKQDGNKADKSKN
jgi:hypothetical protein